MSFCLFKLKFLTPVHIGSSESARSLDTGIMSFCADTLFSGLCHNAKPEGIETLREMAERGRILFSDALPYDGERLYLPKPYMASKHSSDEPNDGTPNSSLLYDRKKMKNLRYIPVDIFGRYVAAVESGENFARAVNADDISNDFGKRHTVQKVSLLTDQKVNSLTEEKSEPYSVGLFSFREGCGLYVIMKYSGSDELSLVKRLIAQLGYTGIGGKVSAGYGKFEAEEIHLDADCGAQTRLLTAMLDKAERKDGALMTLTASLPRDDELESAMSGCTYSLIRRGGFVQSDEYGADAAAKKRTQYFFAAGSVFANSFEGDVYDVSQGGPHPVYRYAKPLFAFAGAGE